MMNDTPLRAARVRDQGAPAEAGRSDTIDGGESTTGADVNLFCCFRQMT